MMNGIRAFTAMVREDEVKKGRMEQKVLLYYIMCLPVSGVYGSVLSVSV